MARFLTSESVTEGHPDKLCDLVSDMVVDDMLSHDPHAHVAAETAASADTVMVFGEVKAAGGYRPDVEAIVREAFRRVGYTDPACGLDAAHAKVLDMLNSQSAEIDAAVGDGDGAGDQGIMIGYADGRTRTRLPLSAELAHALARRLAAARRDGSLPWLRPDGKTQVTVRSEGGRTVVDTVLVSAQHDPDVARGELVDGILDKVVSPALSPYGTGAANPKVIVNPSGSFVLGGPAADAGLTGRKIVVDQYGGVAPVGGGALSGKDPTKVDRSGAYAARWVARSIIDAGLAERAQVRVAYAIGRAEPIGVDVETFGTSTVPEARIARAVGTVFDLTPKGIIAGLDLARPIYTPTSSYGHFGREGFPWEDTTKSAPAIRAAAGL